MGFFKRLKESDPEEADDCQHLSDLGNDEDAWDGLDDDELKQVVSVKFIEYGATQDRSRIPGLFALYRHSMQRLDVDERREMLPQFSAMPAYAGGESMKLLSRTSFDDYLEKIRPRLEALEEKESEPKIIHRIFKIWKEPEAFRGTVG